MLKFDIFNRFTGLVQFTAEIDCGEDVSRSVKMGLAVRWGVKNGANLRGADLRGADLRGAYLRDANLRGAYLRDANLRYANLSEANLRDANLRYANLSEANLRDANLRGADLRDANLSGADLRDANLRGANLRGAEGADLAIASTRILPDGDLIGWKQCCGGVIVKLKIPADAKRSHAFGRKCRAEFADCLEIFGAEEATSQHDATTTYKVGERVACREWGEDWMEECAGGIHFFITRAEAEAY